MTSTDKRSVATDALETLGHCPIPDDSGRDAIHLAVEPVVAGMDLYPGQHVGLENGRAWASAAKKLGIVDPFLKGRVEPGQRFWLVVYPRQITSLRHVWSHPDFAGEGVPTASTDPVEVSRLWIEKFAATLDQTPNRLMEAAENYVECGDYTYDNSERYKNHWEAFPEFWRHYTIVTGNPAPKDATEVPFTCSC